MVQRASWPGELPEEEGAQTVEQVTGIAVLRASQADGAPDWSGCGRPWHCELTNLPGGWSRQGAETRVPAHTGQ